ncbi:hypothetical protein BDW02DRAFT_102959 [Decorospora gaudefroyi]|uniref:Uncharacterized protein n=1 Tax=Decorospora gaudefroyi TaxID=184978 RepID=A0A6A5K7D0_9PLEO|nr:hypothetical protein BDW02DRAFT_102959 [Decorospora gaudefroyi]
MREWPGGGRERVAVWALFGGVELTASCGGRYGRRKWLLGTDSDGRHTGDRAGALEGSWQPRLQCINNNTRCDRTVPSAVLSTGAHRVIISLPIQSSSAHAVGASSPPGPSFSRRCCDAELAVATDTSSLVQGPSINKHALDQYPLPPCTCTCTHLHLPPSR